MGIQDDIQASTASILATPWNTRQGTVVPTTDTVALSNGAVIVNATYLYADLAGSSEAAQKLKKEVTAKILRCYLDAATRVIKRFDGEIRSFDGDRVMGIFIGSSKNRSAVRAALGISWAVHKVVRPKLAATWSDLENHYRISHGVGVDTGDAWIVRGGVRGDNDLISVGAAPNVAAKLSSLRRGPSIYVTDAVYNDLSPDLMATNGQAMWARSAPLAVGGKNYGVVSSTWHWAP